MSYVVLPDPHPGRCRNHRSVHHAPGGTVRCLEYEGTEHVCRFPEAAPPEPITAGIYAQTVKPEPWVAPPAGTPCTICRTHHTVPGNCGGTPNA